MKSIFDPDNVIVRGFIKLGYIWVLNILWLVTSIPIITIGASTTALIYSCMKLHDDDGYPWKNYFHSFKDNLRQATGIWLLYLVVGACLCSGLIYWNQNGIRTAAGDINILWALTLALCIFYLITLEWVFAIQSKFVNTVANTIHFAIVLPFKHLKETIMMLVVIIAVAYLNITTVFAVNYFTISLGLGVIAYLFAVYYINVFKQYIPVDPETEDVRTKGYVSGSIDDPTHVVLNADELAGSGEDPEKDAAYAALEEQLRAMRYEDPAEESNAEASVTED